MKLTFLTMPVSTNQLYAEYRGRRIKTARGRDNQNSIGWEARQQYQGQPVEGDISLKIALWWPTKRNHDIDNIKGLLDALTGILWVDDGQINELHITKGYDKQNPRVEMELCTPTP